MQIADQPRRVLQLRDIDVEIHPIDALHLEPHMLGQDISDGSRYGHDGLRSDGRPAGQLTATCGSYTGPVRRSRSPTDRSPPTTAGRRHDSSGWGEAPVSTAAVVRDCGTLACLRW